MWSQRVEHQARACGFEAEMKAAEREGLSVETDVFGESNIDFVRLRDAHVAWMTLINNCRRMAIEIVQCNETPNDAWRNHEPHYRAKGRR